MNTTMLGRTRLSFVESTTYARVLKNGNRGRRNSSSTFIT
ncbi:hypothetical protein EJP02_361 [Escherichia phage EJP2]|nr:hypothetical protein EJP02_361 [Escherichia phage EJP2]